MDLYSQAGVDNGGINMQTDCLVQGNCSLNVYQALHIREGNTTEGNSAKSIIQDTFLGATFFIGTICTIALIWSGFLMMTAGAEESQFDKGAKGIKSSIIGLILVACSYMIIRVIQFVAQGEQ